MKIPFGIQKRWPLLNQTKRFDRRDNFTDEQRYGFAEDDDICEAMLNELLDAYGEKNSAKVMNALEGLIRLIKGKERNASNP